MCYDSAEAILTFLPRAKRAMVVSSPTAAPASHHHLRKVSLDKMLLMLPRMLQRLLHNKRR